MSPRLILAAEALLCLTHTPPGGGGSPQKLAAEGFFGGFLAAEGPAAGGKILRFLAAERLISFKKTTFLERKINLYTANYSKIFPPAAGQSTTKIRVVFHSSAAKKLGANQPQGHFIVFYPLARCRPTSPPSFLAATIAAECWIR